MRRNGAVFFFVMVLRLDALGVVLDVDVLQDVLLGDDADDRSSVGHQHVSHSHAGEHVEDVVEGSVGHDLDGSGVHPRDEVDVGSVLAAGDLGREVAVGVVLDHSVGSGKGC